LSTGAKCLPAFRALGKKSAAKSFPLFARCHGAESNKHLNQAGSGGDLAFQRFAAVINGGIARSYNPIS